MFHVSNLGEGPNILICMVDMTKGSDVKPVIGCLRVSYLCQDANDADPCIALAARDASLDTREQAGATFSSSVMSWLRAAYAVCGW